MHCALKIRCPVGQRIFDILFAEVLGYFHDMLSAHRKPGGTLTVAHGISRAAIDRHHEGKASKVSIGLMHEDALSASLANYLTVTTKISDDTMYQVAGQLK